MEYTIQRQLQMKYDENTLKTSSPCFFLLQWKYKTSGKIKITKDSLGHIQREYFYGACCNLAMLIAIGVQINV